MTCPDCEFVHEVNRNLSKMVGDLNRDVGHWKGMAAQNRVCADIKAAKRIRLLEAQLKELRGE